MRSRKQRQEEKEEVVKANLTPQMCNFNPSAQCNDEKIPQLFDFFPF